MPYIGSKVKEKTVEKIDKSLKKWLPNDEFIVAFFKVSHHSPLTDVVVITNHRLLSVYSDGLDRYKGFPTEIIADDIKDVTMTKYTDKLVITLKDGTKKKIGSLNVKEDQETFLKALDRISGSPMYLNIDEKQRQAEDLAKQTVQEEKQNSKEQQKQYAEAYNDKWQSIITGKVNKAALREIKSSCREGEMPEFILGDGINGVLAAFGDRCMVIKKGLGTSIMASSLGGGRVATFAYRDITGIEYNSGIMSGVLEILTASYTGKTTNSPWTFGNDRSAHESSNTLPWGKIFYSKVRPQIEWLKQKIVESKTSGNQSVPASQSLNATDELSKLANMHKQGILTDKEFEAAKHKIIGKM